jgi:hypothetical protein
MSFRVLSISLLVLLFVSCKKNVVPAANPDIKGTYWSIVQFAMDQWATYHGQPISLVKIVKEDYKVDSSYVSALKMDWGTDVFKYFFATDISDKKYLGHYNFSSFDETTNQAHVYSYEAIDEDLFTRKLWITTDPSNNKILSIYIETRKNADAKQEVEKLYFKPQKLIQIQQFENSSTGLKMEKEIKYRFL